MGEIASKGELGISISVVSHKQICLIESLLGDLDKQCRSLPFEVLLTLNLEEPLPFDLGDFPFPIVVIRNSVPQGFAANHNQAFTHARGKYFCVINPDIRLKGDPFKILVSFLKAPVGVVGPLVVNTSGEIEDSARHFPSPFKILCKVFGKCMGSDYAVGDSVIYPDWIGGMFMLFSHDVFEKLKGFDPRFFLYYEDVDLCARLRLQGYEVALCPSAKVVHEARRDSHGNMKYFRWHLASMLRFFLSPVYWRLHVRR